MTVEQVKHDWFDYYPKGVAPSFSYTEAALSDYLVTAAKEKPNSKAIHFMGTDMNYKELFTYAAKFARVLQDVGVKKGTEWQLCLRTRRNRSLRITVHCLRVPSSYKRTRYMLNVRLNIKWWTLAQKSSFA